MTTVPRVIYLFAALVLSAAALVPAVIAPGDQASAAAGEVSIHIDGSAMYQKIDGFGVNANARSWNNGQLAPALDLLVDRMGAQIFRVVLEKSDWQPTPDATDGSLYESPKFQNLWGTIGYLNAKHVPLIMLNLMGTIPDWLGGNAISPSQEDQWVNMVASMVSYGRNVRHLQFTLLSPMNETDAGPPEGPRVGPEQYVRLMDKLAARLSALGLDDVRLVGPDAASAAAGASNYAPLMLADKALMSQVDHLSVHSYSADTGPMPSTLRQSAYGDRNFWVTEWSAWCQGCDNGRPVEAEWSFASSTTDLLLDHLEHGASAALVYEGYDSYYEHHGSFSYWGQLAFDSASGSYTPRKRFYTNAQVYRFVQPGMVRIGGTSSDNGVRALSFRDPSSGRLTIVGHNARSSDAALRISLQGVQVAGAVLHLYQTTFATDLAQGPDAVVQDGVVSASVAADGFFTLTTEGESSPQPAVSAPAAPPAAPAPPASADAAPPASAPVAPSAPAQPATATGMLVGEAGIQPVFDTNAPGTAEAFQFIAVASGLANGLYLYVGAGSTAATVQVGLYADAGGGPASLLGAGTLTSPKVSAWNRLEIPPIQVDAGTRYWIAILGPVGGGTAQFPDAGDSGGRSVTSADTGLAGLPATWSTGSTWSSAPLSAYAAQQP